MAVLASTKDILTPGLILAGNQAFPYAKKVGSLVLLSTLFEGADGTSLQGFVPEVGNPFSVDSNSFEIQSNEAESGYSFPSIASVDVGQTNYIITANCRRPSGTPFGGAMGICARYSNAANNFQIYFSDNSGGSVNAFKEEAGGRNMLATQNGYNVAAGSPSLELRVECIGNEFAVFVNGAEAFSFTNSFNNSATRVAVFGSRGYRVQDILVTAP